MLESSLLIASLSQAQLHAAVEPLCRRRTEKRAGRGHGRDHQHRQRPRAERRDAATAQAVLAGHQRSDSRPCFWCVLEPLHAKKNRLRRLVNYHYNNLKWGLVITGNYPVIFLLVITAQITAAPIVLAPRNVHAFDRTLAGYRSLRNSASLSSAEVPNLSLSLACCCTFLAPS